MSESQSVGAIKNNCMTSMAACVLCGKGPVDSEVDSSEDDDDTLCSKLEPYNDHFVHEHCYLFHPVVKEASQYMDPRDIVKINPTLKDEAVKQAREKTCYICSENGASAEVKSRKGKFVHLLCAKEKRHQIDMPKFPKFESHVHPLSENTEMKIISRKPHTNTPEGSLTLPSRSPLDPSDDDGADHKMKYAKELKVVAQTHSAGTPIIDTGDLRMHIQEVVEAFASRYESQLAEALLDKRALEDRVLELETRLKEAKSGRKTAEDLMSENHKLAQLCDEKQKQLLIAAQKIETQAHDIEHMKKEKYTEGAAAREIEKDLHKQVDALELLLTQGLNSSARTRNSPSNIPDSRFKGQALNNFQRDKSENIKKEMQSNQQQAKQCTDELKPDIRGYQRFALPVEPPMVNRVLPPGATFFRSHVRNALTKEPSRRKVELDSSFRESDSLHPPSTSPSDTGKCEDGVLVERQTKPPVTKVHVNFGATYFFQMGKKGKTQEIGRSFPCDDAMDATNNTLVVCDGASDGGETSGQLARQIAQAVVNASIKEEYESIGAGMKVFAGANCSARLLLAASHSESVRRVMRQYESAPSKASTTTTVLSLCGHISRENLCCHVDAVEIGDSQWALMRPNGDDKKWTWTCQYLSPARMYSLDACSKPECPLQISAKHDADFFLKNNADTVQSVSLHVKKEGTCDDIIIAGTDGLWKNFNDGNCVLKHHRLKDKLEDFCTRQWNEWAKKREGKFVSFLGKGIRKTVTDRLQGPHTSSLSNQRICIPDDVSIFVGAVGVTFRLHPQQACCCTQDEHQRGIFSTGKIDHENISNGGVELDCGVLTHTAVRIIPTGTRTGVDDERISSDMTSAMLARPKEERFEIYRTNLCRNFQEKGRCIHGNNCIYAHGDLEVRCKCWVRHLPCRSMHCRYRHDTQNPAAAAASLSAYNSSKKKGRRLSLDNTRDTGPSSKRHRGL